MAWAKERNRVMYEYVPRSEYSPVRNDVETFIKQVQNEMRKDNDLPFQFALIGSGKRHLVTRIKGGNGGYDFDYNLIISPPGDGYSYRAKVVKQQFMEAFKHALRGTQYSFPKDSTSAITIKMVDKKNKRICHSFDFAIIYYDDRCDDEGYYYLRNNKSQRCYEFAFRALRFNVQDRVSEILEEYTWDWIRDEYLKLKNINEGNGKHSFSLYIEAVNNVYNQLFLQYPLT